MAEVGDRHWWYHSTRALLRQLLEQRLDRSSGALYLDAGGGTGATGGWMTAMAPTVLADFEWFALSSARDDYPGYLPVRTDLNHVPFADAAFSAVLCVTTLYHQMNPDPAAIVRELARITRPGGLVCLMEPGGRRLRRGHDRVTHTARRFSVADLRSLAVGAGLEVERATGAYSFLVPPAALMGVAERGRRTSDVGRHETGLGGLLGALATLERRVIRHVDIPFGLSAIAVARKPL